MMLLDGTTPKYGDVITWNVEDRDDNVVWKFTGIISKADVIYLGGGCDFGLGIGKLIPFADVIEESKDNDPAFRGITKVGVAMDVVRLIESGLPKETP